MSTEVTSSFELRRVSVAFGDVHALRNVTLDVPEGQRVALVGPSGAGKTTLLRLFNGMCVPTSGTVVSLGQDLATISGRKLRSVRARLGFVPQDLGLVPELRVSQNVAAGRIGRHGFWGATRDLLFSSPEREQEIHELLERVGIPEKLYQRTESLSGGQQQRVAIARALFQEPRALLADEPVASVDPARARGIIELLCEVTAERKLTFVASLHHLELAREFFPRLVGLRDGQVVFDRAPRDIEREEFEDLYRFDESGLEHLP